MISIHSEKLQKHLNGFKTEIDTHIKSVQTKLSDWLGHPVIKDKKGIELSITENQYNYIKYLKRVLPKIVVGNNTLLLKYLNKFNSILSKNDRDDKAQKYTEFKDKLLVILGYSDLRSTYNGMKNPLFVDFYQNFGIKSCVYCNSQLTIVAEEITGTLRARFQIDHFLDKASYPCFSISFFNLYPVCGSCNNKKSNKEVKFQLYSNELKNLNKSNFSFTIDKTSLANFRISRNPSNLKILFDDKESGLNELFAIEGIYKTQTDLAAEIINKADAYNESYKSALRMSLNNLYSKVGDKSNMINFNRIIIGNYCEPKDIHKRPMAKFTQDIARQLNLLPKIK
jgi:hypothetical protein